MTHHLETTSNHKTFGGEVRYCTHASAANKCTMSFAVFLPPERESKPSVKTPYLLFLSGLTCTADNFATKAGAFAKAAELGLAIVIPDTSPRGDDVPNDDAYDLGQGAGFYLNATQAPWAEHFQMESYLLNELLPLVEAEYGLSSNKRSIAGHSMGGHGALTLHYRHPGAFASCSAFAPIVAPTQVPWGKKVFSAYLGENQKAWRAHDACELVANAAPHQLEKPILIDQGLADNFLEEQLKPELFETACQNAGQKLILRRHEGYDHSYFFIQSFINDHLEFHANKIVCNYGKITG